MTSRNCRCWWRKRLRGDWGERLRQEGAGPGARGQQELGYPGVLHVTSNLSACVCVSSPMCFTHQLHQEEADVRRGRSLKRRP
ncbi:hypothetical protein FKM82_028136 [Ascaphus truei]